MARSLGSRPPPGQRRVFAPFPLHERGLVREITQLLGVERTDGTRLRVELDVTIISPVEKNCGGAVWSRQYCNTTASGMSEQYHQ